MWPNEWPLTISRSLWPIFHASVILPFIFITISWRIVIPGLLYLCDKMIYIQIHLGQCDLYYMVEWFRHITWKLFHRNMSYPFDLIILGHCDLYFVVHWFSLIKEDSVMQKYHTWIIISIWPEDCPQYSSVWPIFHGSLIFVLTLNTISLSNTINQILVPYDPMIDIKIYLGQCDLHFMIQGFLPYILKLFDRQFHLSIYFHVIPRVDLKICQWYI